MEKLVIGLSHFWSAHMVCVGWIQHIVNLQYIVYRDDDVQSTIDDAHTSSFVSTDRQWVPELVLQSGLSFWV
jgi:hypothetical protein